MQAPHPRVVAQNQNDVNFLTVFYTEKREGCPTIISRTLALLLCRCRAPGTRSSSKPPNRPTLSRFFKDRPFLSRERALAVSVSEIRHLGCIRQANLSLGQLSARSIYPDSFLSTERPASALYVFRHRLKTVMDVQFFWVITGGNRSISPSGLGNQASLEGNNMFEIQGLAVYCCRPLELFTKRSINSSKFHPISRKTTGGDEFLEFNEWILALLQAPCTWILLLKLLDIRSHLLCSTSVNGERLCHCFDYATLLYGHLSLRTPQPMDASRLRLVQRADSDLDQAPLSASQY